MYYEWEWVSDLAIIPAFELFVIGVMVGMIFTLCIVAFDRATKGGKNMKGIDISHYQQGLKIKQVMAAGNDFVIIKLTEGASVVDAAAYEYYQDCYALEYPVGCYCYSHATTPEQARAEAKFLLGTLNGFPMPCGIYMDVEAPEMLELSNTALRAVVDAFCDTVRKAGYTPGLYGSELNLWAKVNPDSLEEDVIVWIARYGRSPDSVCDLWQSSDSGRVAGYDGPVDTDEVRSERFKALVKWKPKEEKEEEPAPDACPIFPPDPSVSILQMVMRYNGYWDEAPDGYKSPAFFERLRQFTDDMEAC